MPNKKVNNSNNSNKILVTYEFKDSEGNVIDSMSKIINRN